MGALTRVCRFRCEQRREESLMTAVMTIISKTRSGLVSYPYNNQTVGRSLRAAHNNVCTRFELQYYA